MADNNVTGTCKSLQIIIQDLFKGKIITTFCFTGSGKKYFPNQVLPMSDGILHEQTIFLQKSVLLFFSACFLLV